VTIPYYAATADRTDWPILKLCHAYANMAELGADAGLPAIDEQTCSDLQNARREDLHCLSLLEVYCEDEVATKRIGKPGFQVLS
jgi:hypothetical protein